MLAKKTADRRGIDRTVEKPKVLIVDDEPDVVHTLNDILNSEGFEVFCAYDGISAVDIAEVDQPQVILLDIMMPMMSGYEVCRQLKNNPSTQAIPVLCLTSANSSEVRNQARDAGAQALLTKPILPRELSAQIRRYLPGGDASSTEVDNTASPTEG